MKRILTAIVALPILLYTVWNDTPYFFVGLTALAVVLALNEFYRLASRAGLHPVAAPAYPAALVVLAAFVRNEPAWVVASIAAVAILSLSIAVSRSNQMKTALASASASAFGIVYTALLAGFLVGVRMLPDTAATPKLAAKLLTSFFAMVMMTDTGAYYAGRALGRHKLAPRVSPGKTIEGSVGGLVAAVLAAVVCRIIFFPAVPISHFVVLGGTIGIVSQVGDLAESLLKRGSEVKDSGVIFPGHGGMLDRLDSILFCAPILYYYWRLFAPAL